MKVTEPTITTYVRTWLALLALLAITIIAAHFDLGAFGLPVALLIAISQAVLILLFFMHLHYSKAEVVVVACAAYLWLGIMLVGRCMITFRAIGFRRFHPNIRRRSADVADLDE